MLLELYLRELQTVCLSNYNLRKKEMSTSVVFISSDQPCHDLNFFLSLASFLVPKCNRNICWSKTLKNKHRNVKFKFPMFWIILFLFQCGWNYRGHYNLSSGGRQDPTSVLQLGLWHDPQDQEGRGGQRPGYQHQSLCQTQLHGEGVPCCVQARPRVPVQLQCPVA